MMKVVLSIHPKTNKPKMQIQIFPFISFKTGNCQYHSDDRENMEVGSMNNCDEDDTKENCPDLMVSWFQALHPKSNMTGISCVQSYPTTKHNKGMCIHKNNGGNGLVCCKYSFNEDFFLNVHSNSFEDRTLVTIRRWEDGIARFVEIHEPFGSLLCFGIVKNEGKCDIITSLENNHNMLILLEIDVITLKQQYAYSCDHIGWPFNRFWSEGLTHINTHLECIYSV
jgi:hypothetical protein